MKTLGISEDQIMEDFLLTNKAVDLEVTSHTIAEWLSTKAGQTIAPSAVMPLVGVAPEFLEASYKAIRAKHGTVAAYLEKDIGLTKDRVHMLKDYFLV